MIKRILHFGNPISKRNEQLLIELPDAPNIAKNKFESKSQLDVKRATDANRCAKYRKKQI